MSKYQNDKLFSSPVRFCSAKIIFNYFSRFSEFVKDKYVLLSVIIEKLLIIGTVD